MFNEAILLQCTNEEQLKNELLVDQFTDFIRNLVLNDFEKLINLLYRIDVDESKLRQVLSANENEDAAKTIAAMIIERQLQKIQWKRSMQPGGESNEEKW